LGLTGRQLCPDCSKLTMENQEILNDGSGKWFAIRVKPQAERVVATIARLKGFEEFLPLYKARRRWSDRFKWVDLPLFPGYLFCRLHEGSRLPILTIPGVLHFVGIGKIPVSIDDEEIAAIQAAIASGLSAEPWPFLNVGQRVRIEEGPLTGAEGILIEVHKKHRIIVSVGLLQRSIAVEIERCWARPLDTARPKPVGRANQILLAGGACV
jgi:transcription termination/antitermination protein NusG